MSSMIVCRLTTTQDTFTVLTLIYTRWELFTLALALTECNYYTRGNICLMQSATSK